MADHDEPRARSRPHALVAGGAIVVMLLAWILATPRSAGPDEPSHNVRAGALVRGQLDGEPLTETVFEEGFEIPAHIGFPDPACYAFAPDVPARCASELPLPSGDELRGTRSADYPVWGHLLPGLGTFAPADAAAWSARALDALVPAALVAVGLVVAARRRAVDAGATLLAVTPMAWFTFAVVNPSGLVIAGGIGLWVALLDAVPDAAARVGPAVAGRADRVVAWLAALSWAALVLPRRDGMVWAVLILSFAVLLTGAELPAVWRRLGRGPQVVAASATVATLAWAARSDTNASRALLAMPLVPLLAVAGRALWRRTVAGPSTVRRRNAVGLVAGGAAVTIVVVLVAVLQLSDARLGFLRLVVGETGEDVTEAIGVLGWLDTPVPTSMLFVWFLALGVLAGAALVAGERALLVAAAAIVLTAVAASWTLTMVQTDESVNYWQGRYYLPLLAGVPIVLGRVRLADRATARRVGTFVGVAGLLVVDVALAAMMRRYGAGIAGSLLPWDWDTYGAPVPPILLLALHVGASIALVRVVWACGAPVARSTGTAAGTTTVAGTAATAGEDVTAAAARPPTR